jgi:hypothetical protein
VLDSKFGSISGGWCLNELARAYGVGLWKNMLGEVFKSYQI